MRLRTVMLGAIVLVGSFAGATFVMNALWPVAPQQARPALVAMPPLQPLTGNSVVLAPAAIALSAISEARDAQAPRDLSGKPQNPVSKLLSNAQLTFTVNRGPFAVSGQPGVLTVNTPLSGQFEAIGISLAASARRSRRPAMPSAISSAAISARRCKIWPARRSINTPIFMAA
jgi:hypothetical protein